MSTNTTNTVTRNADANRYEIRIDGNLAGVVEYDERDGHIEMTHTEVVEEYRGGDAASALAGQAIRDAVDRDLTIVPSCPYIEKYLHRHEISGAKVDWPTAD